MMYLKTVANGSSPVDFLSPPPRSPGYGRRAVSAKLTASPKVSPDGSPRSSSATTPSRRVSFSPQLTQGPTGSTHPGSSPLRRVESAVQVADVGILKTDGSLKEVVGGLYREIVMDLRTAHIALRGYLLHQIPDNLLLGTQGSIESAAVLKREIDAVKSVFEHEGLKMDPWYLSWIQNIRDNAAGSVLEKIPPVS